MTIKSREHCHMERSLDHTTVNSFLRGLRYPLTREELLILAGSNEIPDDLLTALQTLPGGEYRSREQVMDALRRLGNSIG
jgi:hypothetical protein